MTDKFAYSLSKTIFGLAEGENFSHFPLADACKFANILAYREFISVVLINFFVNKFQIR